MGIPDPLTQRMKLSNGETIPSIHLGTYLTRDRETYQAVLDALEVGYRAFDSAQLYENEREVGAAINSWLRRESFTDDSLRNGCSERKRSDIHYTTKLAENSDYDKTMQSIRDSVQACGLGYIDLFLLHSPYGGPSARGESWRAVEDAMLEGLVKSGGVSNFGVRHLKELLQSKIRFKPSVNQIEIHPFNTRSEIVNFCRDQGIQIQAYSPLVHGLRMNHSTIISLSNTYSCTPSQLLIRWSVQHGYIALPKTTKKNRMIENVDISGFKISDEDMAVLDALDEGLATDWDPTDAP
ncbi:Aldo/keto reductase [Lepidopterella palustris CBS 459.81]|uniref:Aldo/keto reductase n=1 Tax=Lepidopterella palustris CBS 459.81 TaxID=1314670 RepID=A0A8E2EEI9_9PEZI|nr:Aldo/keto reductase [Lepidopterella palustris CBS 459.81]